VVAEDGVALPAFTSLHHGRITGLGMARTPAGAEGGRSMKHYFPKKRLGKIGKGRDSKGEFLVVGMVKHRCPICEQERKKAKKERLHG
jgi:hypothetical protein